MKLQVTRDRWYAFLGGKTALVLNDLILEKETLYGLMAGAGVDVLETLRLEAGGGYFQKGIVPGLANQGIARAGERGGRLGAGRVPRGRAGGHERGLPAVPERSGHVSEASSRPRRTRAGCRYSVSLEGSYLVQTLEDPDVFAQHGAAGRARRWRCRRA